MSAIIIHEVDAPLASLPNPPEGMRCARVLTIDLAHRVPWWQRREFHVQYPADKQFNIVPPQWQATIPYLADTAVWEMRAQVPRVLDDVVESMLTQDERRVAQVMPPGWSFADMAQYHGHLLQPEQWQKTRMLHRATWLMPLCHSPKLMLHPTAPQLFTIEELCTALDLDEAIARSSPDPREWIARATPRAVIAWIREQARLCEEDAWDKGGGEDWESRYDRASNQWVGKDTHGALWKTFDLTQYWSKEPGDAK